MTRWVSAGATLSTVRTKPKRPGSYPGARSSPSVSGGKAGKRCSARRRSMWASAASGSNRDIDIIVAPRTRADTVTPIPPTWKKGHGVHID